MRNVQAVKQKPVSFNARIQRLTRAYSAKTIDAGILARNSAIHFLKDAFSASALPLRGSLLRITVATISSVRTCRPKHS